MANFDPNDYEDFFDEEETVEETPKPKKNKKKKKLINNDLDLKTGRGCALGCVVVFALFILFALLMSSMSSCGSNNKEQEWLDTLEANQKEVQELYRSDAPDKADKARELMTRYEEEYSKIMDETGENQSNNQLIRGYVDVRAMAVAVKHMAENDEAEKYKSEYFQAGAELTQIIKELKQ